MKKFAVILSVLLAVSVLGGCGGKNANQSICGEWKTENMGYYTVTAFKSDGTFVSEYSLSEKGKNGAFDIDQEVLDSMRTESFYKQVPQSELSEEEKELSGGKNAIKTYASKEDMEADRNGEISFYTLDGDTLTINDSVYTRVK